MFTKYANDKFAVLERHGFVVTKVQVEQVLKTPDAVDASRAPVYIAQRRANDERVLKAAYKKEGDIVKVLTFYPGKTDAQ
ncbi:MAG: hypothetical protein AAB581_02705 [Patescibacteria group bacterium]